MDSIRFDILKMINFRRFADTEIDLDPKLTVISGRNGAGKSSILVALTYAMSWIIARIRNDNGRGQYIKPLDVRKGSSNPLISVSIPYGTVKIPEISKKGIVKSQQLDIDCIKDFVSNIRNQYTQNELDSLPVFVSYGVKRAVVDIPLRLRQHDYSMMDAYDKCLEGAANFREFFTWFRSSEDWENEMRTREDANTRHPGLEAFRNAMRTFMPDYSDFRIRRKPLAMMASKNGKALNIEQLSDGEKIYIALIGDLCHRLSLANPNSDPLLGNGVVLIDEIDLHLHPQWQSEIAARLIETFPNIQFVVSTHSPHVLNSVPTSSIRMIDHDGNVSEAEYGYGIPSAVVLHDLMNLSDDVPKKISGALSGFYEAIRTHRFEDARDFLQIVDREAPKHPDLSRMRKILNFTSR